MKEQEALTEADAKITEYRKAGKTQGSIRRLLVDLCEGQLKARGYSISRQEPLNCHVVFGDKDPEVAAPEPEAAPPPANPTASPGPTFPPGVTAPPPVDPAPLSLEEWVNKYGVEIKKDGDMYVAIGPNFRTLQQDHAGFGATPEEAAAALREVGI